MEWFADNPHIIIAVIKTSLMLGALITGIVYIVLFERKVIAHMQSRWGPHRVGPHGLLQPMADGLKFLFKEDVVFAGATSKVVYMLAPFLSVALGLMAIAVIPFGQESVNVFGTETGLYIADIDVGLLFVLAVTSLSVYAVSLAGWSSNSKYPLLGGLRSASQMISYELALSFAIIGPLLMANTLSLQEITLHQQGHWGGFIPKWYVLPQFLAFLIFFIGGLAETNRVPFDLPEAESELVAGFHAEYSSIKFAMFFLGEYAHMITTSLVASVLFFGGWLSPFPDTALWDWTYYLPAAAAAAAGFTLILSGLKLSHRTHRFLSTVAGLGAMAIAVTLTLDVVREVIQGPFWLLLKTGVFLFVFIWIRATVPRFRYDQLMAIGWKLLIPLGIINIIITSFVIASMGAR